LKTAAMAPFVFPGIVFGVAMQALHLVGTTVAALLKETR
jgi:ABC-type spermidine/putrescine transport system permease subunit II